MTSEDIEAVKRVLRWEPTERLRARLHDGDADAAMLALIREELASRLSLVPQPADSPAEHPGDRVTDRPPPLPEDASPTDNDALGAGPLNYERADIEPTRSRPWIWLLVFIVALIFCGSFGVNASSRSNNGFLQGVIFLQAVLLTGIIAVLVSFAKSSSGWGVLGRIFMLLIVLALTGAVSFCAFFVRHGWGGG